MKRISQAVVLVFFVSLLTGCDDKTTEPTISLKEEVEKLDECTEAQKAAIEQTKNNDGVSTDCINTEANSQVTESELRAAIDKLKDRVASENRASCKLTSPDVLVGESVLYCMPPNNE